MSHNDITGDKIATKAATIHVKLVRDLYRWENGVRLVFAKAGETLEAEGLSEKVDWLAGCKIANLVAPLDNGRIIALGEGYDFKVVES